MKNDNSTSLICAMFLTIRNSDLDSADIANLKFIAKSSDDVATSALLNKIVLEVK